MQHQNRRRIGTLVLFTDINEPDKRRRHASEHAESKAGGLARRGGRCQPRHDLFANDQALKHLRKAAIRNSDFDFFHSEAA